MVLLSESTEPVSESADVDCDRAAAAMLTLAP
jgi:hypothetical protein